MISNFFKEKFSFSNFLFCLLPLILLQPKLSIPFFLAGSFLGLYYLIKKNNLFERKIFKFFFRIVLIYAFFILFSIFFPINNLNEILRAKGLLIILIAPLFLVYLNNVTLKSEQIISINNIFLFICFIILVYRNQTDLFISINQRILWPIQYAIVLVMYSWIFSNYKRKFQFSVTCILNVLFFYFFFTASYRSMIITVFFLIILYIFLSKNYSKNDNFIFSFSKFILLIYIIFLFYYIFSNPRFLSIFDNLNYFSSFYNQHDHFNSALIYDNSVNIRLDFFISGLVNFSNSPLFGNGLLTTKQILFDTFSLLPNGDAMLADHFHNTYLTILSEQGIFGFIPFIIIFIVLPFLFFKKNLKHSFDNKNCIFGILVLFFYLIYNLYDSFLWIGADFEIIIFFIYLFLPYLQIINKKN